MPNWPILLHSDAALTGLRQAVDGIHHEVIAVHVIQHGHVEWRGDGTLLLVASHMNIFVIGPTIRQPVDQPRIAVKCENHRFVRGEQILEFPIAQPVRVFGIRLQFHEIHNVYHPDFHVGQQFAHDRDRSERFESRYIAATRHHDVGGNAGIVTGPRPAANACAAVFNSGVHREPLRCRMLSGDHDVHVLAAPQTMVHH